MSWRSLSEAPSGTVNFSIFWGVQHYLDTKAAIPEQRTADALRNNGRQQIGNAFSPYMRRAAQPRPCFVRVVVHPTRLFLFFFLFLRERKRRSGGEVSEPCAASSPRPRPAAAVVDCVRSAFRGRCSPTPFCCSGSAHTSVVPSVFRRVGRTHALTTCRAQISHTDYALRRSIRASTPPVSVSDSAVRPITFSLRPVYPFLSHMWSGPAGGTGAHTRWMEWQNRETAAALR